jgi:benzil reductase ((S)-benzoin forming)
VPIDLSSPEEAADTFAQALEPLVAIDFTEVVAFSNAAELGPVGPVQNASPSQIANHFDVNLVSAVLFARAYVQSFQSLSCPKTFVNISSGAAARPYAGWSLYSASKAALETFVRAVALEQASHAHPIRAISINPGVMDTAMQVAVRSASIADFPSLDRFLRLQHEGRLASPAAVALQIADIVHSRPEPGGVYSVAH